MREPYPLKPGDVVRSRRGKDEGQLMVVLNVLDERLVLVADGGKRRFDKPKRKNVIHLEPVGFHSEEVARSLSETGRVTNAKLRHAIVSAREALGLAPQPADDANSGENDMLMNENADEKKGE